MTNTNRHSHRFAGSAPTARTIAARAGRRLFAAAAVLLCLGPAASAFYVTEESSAAFGDGYFYRSTATAANDVRINEWNDWYDDAWSERRPITINNAGLQTLTNYQVEIVVNTQELITAGRLRQDMRDIRFCDEDGMTPLPYYVMSGSGTATRIWTKVSSIGAGSQKNIYLYFNNLSTGSWLSNPAQVFDLFEDWETGTVAPRWNRGGSFLSDARLFDVTASSKYQGGYSIQSGTITHNESTYLSVSINLEMAGRVTFYWSISSEAIYDVMQFLIDGNEASAVLPAGAQRISGTQPWGARVYDIPAGSHILRWQFVRDTGGSGGLDRGWLDSIIVQKYTSSPPSLTPGADESRSAYYPQGIYQSGVIDAGGEGAVVKRVSWTVDLPGTTNAVMKMRASDTPFAANALSPDWSNQLTNNEYPLLVTIPPGRYLQYQTTLNSNGTTSPRLLSFSIEYESPPTKPSNFNGVVISSTVIRWTWNDNAAGPVQETGIFVYSSTGGVVRSLAANTTQWTETGLTPNTTYARYVAFYNAVGTNTSNTANFCTLPMPPKVKAEYFEWDIPNGELNRTFHYAQIATGTWTANATFYFTSEVNSGPGFVEYYRFAWSTQAVYAWTDTEMSSAPASSYFWNSVWIEYQQAKAQYAFRATFNSDSWYLHSRSYNRSNAAGESAVRGPFFFNGCPSRITDLVAASSTSNEGQVRLSWTAPTADATTGNLSGARYVVKWSSLPILAENEFNAAPGVTISTSATPGEPQQYTVTGLTPGGVYWFAIRTVDNQENYSLVSTNDADVLNTRATAAKVTKIVFKNPPLATYVGIPTTIMTVECQDAAGNPLRLNGAANISFGSTSSDGEFSLYASPWVPASFVNIPQGGTQAQFYYKDINVGTGYQQTISVAESPSQGWTAGTQIVTIFPGKAVQFLVDAPASQNIGATANIAVRANDGYNSSNVTGDYQGLIAATATIPGSLLTSSVYFGPSDSGQKTLSWYNPDYAGQGTVSVVEEIAQSCTGVFFIDTLNGFIAGSEGTIKKTVNGGAQWFALRYSTGTGNELFAVTAANGGNNALATGTGGKVLVSTDGIQSASLVTTGAGGNLYGAFYVNISTVYACGDGGKVMKSTDSGFTWSNVSPATAVRLRSLYFVSPSSGFVCGAGGTLLRTTNGGGSWSAVSLPGSPSVMLNRLSFAGNDNGFVCGDGGKIYRTVNGGETWTDVSPAGVTDNLNGIHFVNATTGFAAGSNRRLLKTTNGGASWASVISTAALQLHGISFAGNDPLTAVAVGDAGLILRTADGGNTWTQIRMSGQSVAVNWNGLVVTSTGVATSLIQGRQNQAAVRIVARTMFGGTSTINQFRVRLLGGTGTASDVAAVKFYRDYNRNGSFDSSDQASGLLGSGTFDGSNNAAISGFSADIIGDATFFMVVNIANTAPLGTTLGFRLNSVGLQACLNVVSGPSLASNNLPIDIAPVTIVPSSCTLNVSIGSLVGQEVRQGERNVLLSSFTMITDRGSTPWQRLLVGRNGINNTDADIESIKLYSGPGLVYDPATAVPVSSAVFGAVSPGIAQLNFVRTIDYQTTHYYFLLADISPAAVYYTDTTDARFWFTFALSTGSLLLDSEGLNGISGNVATFTTPQVRIRQAFDTLSVEPILPLPSFPAGIDQSKTEAFIPVRMYVEEEGGRVDLLRLRVQQTGSASDADIDSVRLYRDNNGNAVFESAGDSLLGSGRFTAGQADLVLTSPEIITRNVSDSVTYFIAVTVAKRAAESKDIRITVSSSAYMLAGADSVSANKSALASSSALIKNFPDTVSVTFENRMPSSVRVDETGILVSKITLWAYCSAVFDKITVVLAGSGDVADIQNVRIYGDTNSDGSFSSSQDTALGNGTFGADRKSVIGFSAPPVVYDSSYTVFVVYDFNPSATPRRTAGFGVDNTGFSFPAEPGANAFGYYQGGLTTLLEKETPSIPRLTLDLDWPSGRQVGGNTVYYTNKPSEMKFTWQATALNGVAEMRYALATYEAIGTTDTPDVTSWFSTAGQDATLDNVNMKHNQRYYLWAKAVSTDGFERINSAEFKVDLTPPAAPGKPSDESSRSRTAGSTARAPSNGFLVSWSEVDDNESGLLYYELEERVGTSPVWVAVTTTTNPSYKVVKDTAAEAGKFFYYRVRARNYAGSWSSYSTASDASYLSLPNEVVGNLGSYPNPFDSRIREATISFILRESANVDLRIYDVFGGLVREWNFGGSAGENRVTWDGTDQGGQKVASGMYILAVEARTGSRTEKGRWKIGVVH